MNWDLLFENLSNPALLFFLLGLLAVQLRSDLEIPPNSSKFISLYLLLAIGFKGGQELSHSSINWEIMASIGLGVTLAVIIPVYTFFLLRKRFGIHNAGAIAAAYGSISAVTFVTAVSYLEFLAVPFDGHMVALMAMMEAPAIIVGVLLIRYFKTGADGDQIALKKVVSHALSNGSVLLIVGSLLIGFLASESQAQGIKPFTTDIFKGFLAVFLLDMGITSGRKLKSLFNFGAFPFLFAIVGPLCNGLLVAWLSALVLDSDGNRFLLSILAASASYIAVPAAMKITVPKSNPGLYLPMALGITFPLNITIGMPLYWCVIKLI